MNAYLCSVALLGGFLLILTNGAPSTTTGTPTPMLKSCVDYTTCDECVGNVSCIFCYTDNKCMDYPKKHIIPRAEDCDLSQSRWGTCVVNYKALLIAMGTIAGALLLSCSCCVLYCCYCRGPSGRQRRKWAKDDAKEERKKSERQMKQDQRKAERQAKNDEIRRKYGLKRDDDGQYHHLEED
ncbi:pituitary tumor-transforming gene 1 protein-interacting protein-like isoform X2 [Apostichopus japonicus]|uniref:pituitary tumor-transforming gene 1 protein-interacting protein-like isoform X2 n=1 Tax=Stichopus japonicus TaxID=307972 RepID=UPI003AB41A7C